MTAPAVQPLALGPANCAAIIGQPWRWTRDTARRLGVPVHRCAGKSWIEAETFLCALRAQSTEPKPPANDVAANAAPIEDEVAAMRARVARAGGR